jgi:hypothetical protein
MACRAKADEHALTYAGAAFIAVLASHELRERLQRFAIARL